jgi:hypothetical protein
MYIVVRASLAVIPVRVSPPSPVRREAGNGDRGLQVFCAFAENVG